MMPMPNPTAGMVRRETLPSAFVRYEHDMGGRWGAYAGLGHTQRMPDYWELFSPTRGPAGAPNAFAGVPPEKLDETVQEWAETICERSPTAIAIAKRSFNMDTAHQSGIAGMGMYALKLYYDTDESREGVNALKDKRKPEFRKYAK